MPTRYSVRALLLTPAAEVLMCRHELPGFDVWAPPGGGKEPGETNLDTLRRELREEVGYALTTDPAHVWHRVTGPREFLPGYDGTVNDYYLVPTGRFEPAGELSDEELRAENVVGFRWWPVADMLAYTGPDIFGPAEMPALLADLVAAGAPAQPVLLTR